MNPRSVCRPILSSKGSKRDIPKDSALKKQTTMSRQQIIKIVISVVIAALTALGTALGLQSCTATRVVSTSASYVQHGDTTTTIMTKTTETYHGEKK
jgi:hypothetical protein